MILAALWGVEEIDQIMTRACEKLRLSNEIKVSQKVALAVIWPCRFFKQFVLRFPWHYELPYKLHIWNYWMCLQFYYLHDIDRQAGVYTENIFDQFCSISHLIWKLGLTFCNFASLCFFLFCSFYFARYWSWARPPGVQTMCPINFAARSNRSLLLQYVFCILVFYILHFICSLYFLRVLRQCLFLHQFAI